MIPLPVIILFGVSLLVIIIMPKTAMAYFNGVASPITLKGIGDGCFLAPDAAAAYLRMQTAAASDGVALKPKGPNSAFRTHAQQVAMAAQYPQNAAEVDHSAHQQGSACDFDLTDSSVLPWMNANAAIYGWSPPSDAVHAKEPWHYEFNGTSVPTDTPSEPVASNDSTTSDDTGDADA